MRAIAAIPVLQVTDVARSAAFYRDVLRFTPGYQEAGFAVMRRDDVTLHLTSASDEDWRTRASRQGASPIVSGAESFLAGTGACLIHIEGVDELYERVRPLGVVHPNGHLQDTAWGTREFGALDPDHNLVTLFESSGG